MWLCQRFSLGKQNDIVNVNTTKRVNTREADALIMARFRFAVEVKRKRKHNDRP